MLVRIRGRMANLQERHHFLWLTSQINTTHLEISHEPWPPYNTVFKAYDPSRDYTAILPIPARMLHHLTAANCLDKYIIFHLNRLLSRNLIRGF